MNIMRNIVLTIITAVSLTGISHGMVGKYESRKSFSESALSYGESGLSLGKVSLAIAVGVPIAAKLIHMAASYYPKQWFSQKAGSFDKEGSARWFAYNKTQGYDFANDTTCKQSVEQAIRTIIRYARNAKEIQDAFDADYANMAQRIKIAKQYAPRTRTMTDIAYRLFAKIRPEGVEPKTAAQILSPLIFVNGKEANELLVQLLEVREQINKAHPQQINVKIV